MASIPKAFNSFERKEMTVSEYDTYLRMHPHQNSIRAIRCVECGDILIYCNGSNNTPYFKHTPTHEGHSYCSLYHEGIESKTNESLIKKKFFQEEDISLNYELLYKNGKWKSLITIPPFKSSEITENEKNKTIITIKYYNNLIGVPVDCAHFLPGEIKQISLVNFSSDIRIKISGNSTKQNIFYDMDDFKPNQQLYSSLVIQNYITSSNEQSIDLREINSFACKRISGYVYTGRHYLVFSNLSNFQQKYCNSRSIEIKRLDLIKDYNFDYYVFDVIFNSIDEDSIDFCKDRNCELVQKDDAVILWPPTKTIGNYHYYANNKTSMFILFENDSKALDISCYDIFDRRTNKIYLFFKVQNINASSYYVTLDKRESKRKEIAKLQILDNGEIGKNKYNFAYLFNKGVMLKRYDYLSRIGKNNTILLVNSQLDRAITKIELSNTISHNRLLNAIRYTREYVNFNNKYSDHLENIYSNDELIMNYINHCKSTKTIKKKALEILMGEVK